MRQIETKRAALQAEYDAETDKRKAKSIKKDIEKLEEAASELGKTEESKKKRAAESIAAIRREIAPDVEKAIEAGIGRQKLAAKYQENRRQYTDFMEFSRQPTFDAVKRAPRNTPKETEIADAMEKYYQVQAEIPQNLVPEYGKSLDFITDDIADLAKTEPGDDPSAMIVKSYNILTKAQSAGFPDSDMQKIRETVQRAATSPYWKA
jgi:hypothetical protein